MNAKQALKAASENIKRLEDFNLRCTNDIKGLYRCIESVIAGEKTYCDWCEDQQECQRECKGKGCAEWWLMMNLPDQPEEEGDTDDSKRVFPASPTC